MRWQRQIFGIEFLSRMMADEMVHELGLASSNR
jgi:hypothetical protein